MTMTEHEITWNDYDTIQNTRYGAITVEDANGTEHEVPVKNVMAENLPGEVSDADFVGIFHGDPFCVFVDEKDGQKTVYEINATEVWEATKAEIDIDKDPKSAFEEIVWEADNGGA